MSAAEVRSLLSTFRPTSGTPSDATVEAWRHTLARCTFGECQAALLALGPSRARTATPEQIIAGIRTARAARTTTTVPRPRVSDADRAAFAASGARGIERVYAAMSWTRNHDRALAQRVACPFCRALPGRLCRPLSRDRSGRAERRDSVSLVHPSRLERACAAEDGGERR